MARTITTGGLTCADCAAPMWTTDTSLPQGQACCRPCRRQRSTRGRDYKARAKFACPTCAGPKWSDGPRPCRKCDHVGDRRPRSCEVCDVSYKPTHSGQRTCSRSCGVWINSRVPKVSPVEWGSCLTCDKVCTTGSMHGFGTCSTTCRDQAQAVLFRPSKPKDLSWRDRQIECPMCGTHFTNAYTTTAIHCSKRCSRKAIKLRRRVREAQSYGEWRWSDFMRMAAKFDYCCAYCGDRPERLDPDHVVPLSKGGPNIIGNLLPTCQSCNSDKQAFTLDKWTERLAAQGRQRHTSWAPEDKRYWHLTTLGEVSRHAA